LPGLIKHYEALREKAEAGRLDIKGSQGELRDFNGFQGVSTCESVSRFEVVKEKPV
jgi:hypothetical protein